MEERGVMETREVVHSMSSQEQQYTPSALTGDLNQKVGGATPVTHNDNPAALLQSSRPHGDRLENMAICASPADDYANPVRNMNRRKGSPVQEPSPSLGALLRKAAIDHQLGISINLFLLAALSYLLFPSLRPRLEVLGTLRYPSAIVGKDGSVQYGQGPQDLGIVLTFMVVLTGVRAATLDYLLTPLAAALGVRKGKPSIRFAEQTYLILYYFIYWTWGVYVFVADTPEALPHSADGQSQPLTFINLLISLWTYFPRLLLNAPMKLYYLSQLAFWVQQIIVIHLEESRKDHYQMLTHHFVTIALLVFSYGFRMMRVGNAFLLCMDIIDLILPAAKVFRYLGWQTACDATFALFAVVWLLCRHGIYLCICWSIYYHVNTTVMPFGVYSLEPSIANSAGNGDIISGQLIANDGGQKVWANLVQPFLDPNAKTVSFNSNIKSIFLGLLMGLQLITFLWFLMICRVIVRVLRGDGADDTRSDDEEEGEEAEADDDEKEHLKKQATAPIHLSSLQPQQQRYIEVEASSADLIVPTPSSTRRSTSSSSKRKSKGLSTGLNLGDHKEILNRIGCLSEEQLAREREKRSPGPSGSGGSSRR